MKNIMTLFFSITVMAITTQAVANTTTHIEGHSPVGPFKGSLRGQAATIEQLIINKAKEICANDSRFYYSNLKTSTISGGGVIDFSGESDSQNSLDSLVSLGQPHSSFSVDISCQ
jgi:hypothetical protein